MPITKKKGAIFAIHADTPDKVSASASASTTAGLASNPNARSPTKKNPTGTGRKALTVKQATVTQPRGLGFPSSSDLNPKAASVKGLLGNSTDDLVKPIKDVYSTTTTTTTTTTKVSRKSLMEKRTRRGESPSPSSNGSVLQAQQSVKTTTTSPKSARTPAKKARVTDQTPLRGPAAAAATLHEAEDNGSPASRTRSKTGPTPDSPAPPSTTINKPRTRRPTISSSLATSSRKPRMDVFEDIENIPIPLPLPIDKQVLDRKTGKDILDLLGRAGSEGPDEVEMAEYEKAYDEHLHLRGKGKGVGGSSKVALKDLGLGMGMGKGRAVLGDMPLADVSEAYGATGSEPRGFKEQ